MPRSPAWPWTLAITVAGLVVAAGVLDALAGSHGAGWLVSTAFASGTLSSAALGLLLALRRPGHPVAWLLLANGLVLALAGVAGAYADYAVLERPGALPAARVAVLWDAQWPLLFAPLTAVAYVFPDGRLPSPAWRRPVTAAAAAFAALLVATVFRDKPFDSPYEHVAGPLPHLPAAVTGPLTVVGLLGLLGALLGAAWALRARFRRASGIERLQLKWLAYAGSLIPLTFAVCMAGSLLTGDGDGALLGVAFIAMLVGIPLAVAVAILRYRLYDIDRLVNRTAVYAVLTILLGGAYVAITLALAVAAGGRSAWTTAVATLAVAVAFRPLRARVQDAVDRRFNRARYDGLRRVDRFLDDLRAGRAAPEQVGAVLGAALGDPALELRYWLPESEAYADARGRPVTDRPDDGRARLPVLRAGAPLALVLHDPELDEHADLRASVVEAAGLAIEIARLRVELRRRLDEVSESRARIVAAGDAERRRIERDLHDGAQQRLISVGLALRHVQHELGPTANGASSALDGAVGEIGHAVADLRELARGVRPAQLDDGLAPALRELGGRAALPVEVDATPERFDPGMEAAAYFVACEALANAAKHAGASRVVVRSTREDGRLVVCVSDDGAGGAVAGRGSGLTGLADRVQAHGGTLSVDSPPGRGTTLTAEFPCGS